MAPVPRQLTIEERLREIEREKSRLEKDMKALRKGRLPVVVQAPEPRTASPNNNLEVPRSTHLTPKADMPERSDRDAQFLNYLASGSFNSRRPLLRHERQAQRNKALFMLAVLALVAYVVWTLLKST